MLPINGQSLIKSFFWALTCFSEEFAKSRTPEGLEALLINAAPPLPPAERAVLSLRPGPGALPEKGPGRLAAPAGSVARRRLNWAQGVVALAGQPCQSHPSQLWLPRVACGWELGWWLIGGGLPCPGHPGSCRLLSGKLGKRGLGMLQRDKAPAGWVCVPPHADTPGCVGSPSHEPWNSW